MVTHVHGKNASTPTKRPLAGTTELELTLPFFHDISFSVLFCLVNVVV